MDIKQNQLFGKTISHLATEGKYAGVLHRDVVGPFQALQSDAAREGFDLEIVSGYRSFSRQLAIWNAKATGSRPVLDDQSKPIDLERLTDPEKLDAILRWSALPGSSRHHWGTDIDVYDRAAIDESYEVRLVPEETRSGGPFAPLHHWLDEALVESDFFRPYAKDQGGTAPEPWHLSYQPVADEFLRELCPESMLSALDGIEIALRSSINENIENIFRRYVSILSN